MISAYDVPMATANVVLSYIEALIWPILVIVALVFILPVVARWGRTPTSEPVPAASPVWPASGSPGGSSLVSALEDAEGLSSFEATSPGDPLVHLQQAVQVSSSNYREAAQKILESYRAGRVVIVDLSTTKGTVSVRLIDFCSAMTLISRGSFFQISSTALVLTPRTE